MATIDGYTFSVDMVDRGVVTTLRQMKAEASAMKASMRSGFETIREGDGTLSAYNFKIQESTRQIENYDQMIQKLKGDLQKIDDRRKANGGLSDNDATSYAKTARQIEIYQHRINQLKTGINSAKVSMAQFRTGLSQIRTATSDTQRVTSSYVERVKSEGNAFRSISAEMKSYRANASMLKSQLIAEQSEYTRLSAKQSRLRSQYMAQRSNVASVRAAHGSLSSEYRKESSTLDGLGEKLNSATHKLAEQAVQVNKTASSYNEAERAANRYSGISGKMNRVSDSFNAATSHTRKFASSVKSGFMTATFAVAPFVAATGKSVQMAAQLQNSWVKTNNLLVTGGESVAATTRNVAAMQRDARKYSIEYGFSQKDIADQYTELVKRGYSARQALGSMKAMLEASRASGDDFSDVVKNVSSVVDAFGLRVTKGANVTERMVRNTNRVTNAMAYAADKSATGFQEMGYAMNFVSSQAHQAGQTVETTTAAIGELSNAGIEGSLAGTGLRKMLRSLIKPTKAATQEMHKYGLSMKDFQDKSGHLKQLPDILETINKHTKGITAVQKGALFNALFGATGQQAATILAQNVDGLKELTKAEKEAEKYNYVNNLAQKNMKSSQMQMEILKQGVSAIGVELGYKLLPSLNEVVGSFSQWVSSKNGQKAIDKVADSITGIARGLSGHSGTIVNFFGGLASGLSDTFIAAEKVLGLIGKLNKHIAGLFGMKTGNHELARGIGEVTGVVLGAIGAFKLLHTTISGLSAVRKDLSTVRDGVSSIWKGKSASKVGNPELDEEIGQLKTDISLWKDRQKYSEIGNTPASNTRSGRRNGSVSRTGEVETAIESEIPNETRMERYGRSRGHGFVRGFGNVLKSTGKGIGNIFLMTLTGGLVDMDDLGHLASKLWGGIRGLFHRGKHSLKVPVEPETNGFKSKLMAFFKRLNPKNWLKGKKFSLSSLFKGSSKEVAQEGKHSGETFTREALRATKKKRFSIKGLFSGASKEASSSGVKTGEKFVENTAKSASKSKGLLSAGKGIGEKLGGGVTVAFGAIDLFQAFTSSNKKDRAKNVGKSIGSTAGGAAGTAIGSTLGSVVPGIGTVIGGLLGGTIGSWAGGKLGEEFGKHWKALKKSAVSVGKFIGKVLVEPFKLAYSAGKWVGDKLKGLTGKGNGSKTSTASPSRKKVTSLGGNNYSAKDRKLVEQMNTAVKNFTKTLVALRKVNLDKFLKSLYRDLRKYKIDKAFRDMEKPLKQVVKSFNGISKPSKTISKSFSSLSKTIKALSSRRGGFNQLSKDVKDFYRTIRKNPFGKLISQQARIANESMSGKKSGFVSQFTRQTNQMTKAVRSFGRAFNRDWKATWRGLDSPVSRSLRSVDSTVRGRLDDIQSRRESFSSSFLKGWNSWIDDVKSSFKSGFNKLPGYAASSMKDIISRLNKGISGVNKVIGDFGGDKKLSAISYATGTKGGHPGGHMLINDSSRPHYKELVKFPGQAWRMFEGRNVLIPNAPKGTEVINGEQTYALNSRGLLPRLGIHAYADGTDDGDEIADKIAKHPFEELKKIFFGATSFNGSPIVQDLGTAMSLGLIKGVQDIIKKMAEEADDNGKAATPAMIRKAAARMGIHDLTDSFVKLLMGVIMTESGNRSIRQSAGVQDVNARSGDWAAGILQYTNQTFMTYAMPGHTNRYKPYDELLAFFNNSDWRNSIGYPGYAHGKPDWLHSGPQGSPRMKHFANGGLVRQQMIATIGENNIPEMIIPLDINKRPRALNLIDSTLDHMEHDGGGTGGLHSRNNNSSEETNSYLKQAVVILGQIAGLNAQQIEAIANLNTGTDMKSRRARRSFYTDYGNDQRIADYQAF